MTRLRAVVPAVLVTGALALGPAASAAAADPVDPGSEGVSTAAVTPGSGPVSVAVVVPLTVPPTTTGLLDADALATYTQDGGLLDRQLDAVTVTPAAIGLDPMIPASIRVLGTSAPESALDFLARLEAASNEVFLLGYADSDPALAAVAGTEGELAPLGFEFAVDPADFGPAETPEPSPTPDVTSPPTPDPTEPPDDGPPPLPTTADLLAWPTTLPAIAWPAEGTVAAEGLAGLVSLGYDNALLSGGNVTPAASALVDLGDIDALVADEDVTDALRDAVYAPTQTEYDAATVTLAAALRSEAITSPGRTIIATLDRRWPFGTPRLAQALSVVEGQSAAQLVRVSDVLAGPKASGTLVEPSSGTEAQRAGILSTLAAALRDEAEYLTIAETPGVITQPRRLALLALSAVGWRVDDVGWNAATADELAAAEKTVDAVQITETSDQLVLSDISSLRLHISNALPVAVTVYVAVRPLRPALHVEDDSVEVTIEPDSSATASIPVQSILNGDVTVRAELHSASGRVLGDARFLKVILQAGWETVGTLVAGALVLLVFGGGLVRTVLRRRRARKADAEPGSD